MEMIRSPKRRFELELHGKESQKAPINLIIGYQVLVRIKISKFEAWPNIMKHVDFYRTLL
jgi:hypothetical protein